MKKQISPVQGTAAAPRFQFVETGLYRNISNGVYFERPSIKGRRTWRSLDTANLKHAREELYRRRAGVRAVEVEKAKTTVTVGDILRHYQKDVYPDRQKQPRVGRTLEMETRNCSVLLKFWDKMPATDICLVECDRYHAWRRKNATKGRGDRAVDMEMNTLSNAVLWAMRCDLIRLNPLNFRRPRYCCAKNVRHCREFMPHDTDALHEIAALLFADRRAEAMGWQMMFEAFTGLRTCEALRMRTDAQPFEPGWITKDGKSLCVRRAKNQESVNPFVQIHDGLAGWLKSHKEWKEKRYPKSPWFFPNYRDPVGKHADKFALTQSLRRRRGTIGKKITSHAMRAFYVTVRRSNGISDIQIAYEIGHTSAGKTLASVYGGVPPHWLTDEGPKMKWMAVPQGKKKYHQNFETSVHTFIPVGLPKSKTDTLVIVEGEFKAMSLVEAGVPAVGMSGFYGFRHGKLHKKAGQMVSELVAVLAVLKPKTILFLGDNDTALNFQFADGVVAFAKLVPKCNVKLPRIPLNMPKGIDDVRESLGGKFDAFWKSIVADAIPVMATDDRADRPSLRSQTERSWRKCQRNL